ncbi:MAG: preprotein translocase subunit YajC [Clostridia bacterium]|nr:preprotein translocase subunit YajC [Clostridia bacterium]MBN2883993.1 preprotein translocase subunit YajC [Clostridia bacterium]
MPEGNSIWSIVSIVAIFGIMYAVLIIPQRRQKKKKDEMLNTLQEGDTVESIGGIVGVVINIGDGEVTIASGVDKTKLVFRKGAIGNVVKKAGDE